MGQQIKLFKNLGTNWTDQLNDVAIGLGGFFVVTWAAFEFVLTDLNSETVRIEYATLALAILNLLFGFLLFKRLIGKYPNLTSGVLLGLVLALVASPILLNGGFESPYLLVWAALSLLAAVFGLGVLLIIWLSSVLLFTINMLEISGQVNDSEAWLLNFIALHGAMLMGFLLWFKTSHTSPQAHKGTIEILSNSLEDEKRKGDIVIQAIADGVVVVGKDGQIKLFNPAAQELTGWGWEDALNLDYRSVLKLADDSGQALGKDDDPFSKAFTDKTPTSYNELSLHTKENKKIDIYLNLSPIKVPDGSISGVIGVFRDVSSERRAQKQRAEFISTASHEMRTPVAAIEGYLALSLNEKVSKIDSKARTYLEKAVDSTNHLGKLFQDLLTSAKAEDGRLTSHPKVTDVGALLEKLVEDLKFTAEKKGLVVDFGFGSSGGTKTNTQGGLVMPIVYASVDPDRIREAITNVFDNAIKYTEEGKITISYSNDQSTITISVRDTGAGIPDEDIPHLFQKFYRVDNTATRQIGGTGLGLFIVQKIIELYSGKIWVESELDKGSTFHISFPRLDNDKAQEMLKKESGESPLGAVQPTKQVMPAPRPKP